MTLQVSLISSIWFFFSPDVNRAANMCIIYEWFCRAVFFHSINAKITIYNQFTIEKQLNVEKND